MDIVSFAFSERDKLNNNKSHFEVIVSQLRFYYFRNKMTLFKIRSAPFVLIEDDNNKNIVPLLSDIVQYEKNTLHLFCYEQSVSSWRNVFKNQYNIIFHKEFSPTKYNEYISGKCSVIVDSVNQMALCLGWNVTLRYLKKLSQDTEVVQIILVLHKDCLTHNSKLQLHLNHIARAIVSYDAKDPYKIHVLLKKSGKVVRSEEILSYDKKSGVLKCNPVVKEAVKEEEPEKPLPENLSTFKIEVEQTDKIEKYKLKLPYMSKIGEGKVYYEPDAVDDWDEEDPDEDLDI